jgi:hypothetical protein
MALDTSEAENRERIRTISRRKRRLPLHCSDVKIGKSVKSLFFPLEVKSPI